jgi:hypothetical protein
MVVAKSAVRCPNLLMCNTVTILGVVALVYETILAHGVSRAILYKIHCNPFACREAMARLPL